LLVGDVVPGTAEFGVVAGFPPFAAGVVAGLPCGCPEFPGGVDGFPDESELPGEAGLPADPEFPGWPPFEPPEAVSFFSWITVLQ
jgi:hypothetical protein